MRLIHPIYLDIPMLVSFAAAIEGGLSFGSEVTREETSSSAVAAEGGAKFGLSNLFGHFLSASAEMKVEGTQDDAERLLEKRSKSHTEASIAILLYDRLRKDTGYIVDLETVEAAKKVEPGALIEVAGTVERNAVDAMIECIDAASILVNLASDEPSAAQETTRGKRQNRPQASKRKRENGEMRWMRDTLDEDRKRTPLSNVLLRCTAPSGVTAVITLRTENLRDLTLSELHRNSVRVLGKVTRVVNENEEMSAFENYGMSLIAPEMLNEVFSTLRGIENIRLDLSEVLVRGPALQILPLMVFV